MRLGLIARADNSGLGIQTLEFHNHMKPDKTMVVDIGHLNGNHSYNERYPYAQFVKGFPTASDIDDFLKDLDIIFVAESPYNYHLYAQARELGVKTAVQYNYEFFDWFAHPEYPKPDLLIAPSKWHYLEVDKWCKENNVKHIYLHCPVNRDKLPQRQIESARTFLHIAGKSAAHDRNGTEIVIRASKLLKTEARIAIHFQGEQGLPHQATHDINFYKELADKEGGYNLEISQIDYENYQDIYRTGDVMVLPRRYGGNCLPMNEALSVGMPVIMPDINPNSGFLPNNWLVPANKISEFTPRTTIDIFDVNPQDLAEKIDEFYNLDKYQMRFENIRAGNLARSISWQSMKPQYEDAFEILCSL